MSVLLSMILYSSWSQNVRGSGDGKRSFYDWHLLKPEKAGKGGVQPAILEVTYIREKKPTLIMRRFISEKQNSVIHEVTYIS